MQSETIVMTPCNRPLPDLEVPMINTMVTCLHSEHEKINFLTMQLALAANRLAADPDQAGARQRAFEVWDEIRRDLWPHLQIEDELVFSWAAARDAIAPGLLDTLKKERVEMHELVTNLFDAPADLAQTPQSYAERKLFAQRLQALAQALDSHVEHYDSEALPSILRAVFRK
jgi:hypothetical protein